MSLLVGEQKLQSHVRCSFVSRLFFCQKMQSGNKTMLGVPWHLRICTQVGCPGMQV